MLRTQIENVIDSQKEMYAQKAQGVLREGLTDLPALGSHALIISGIRRCGKSTLQRQLMQTYHDILFVNFEDTRLLEFEVSDFSKLFEIIRERDIKHAFFDEMQVVLGWEVFVRHLLDFDIKVCVTGSNASLLSRELGTKLTGRHLTRELFPFSFTEFCSLKNQDPTKQQSLLNYFVEGGFPDFLKSGNLEELQTVFTDILTRDIAVRHQIRDFQALQMLASFLVSNVGKPVSAPKLKQVIQVKANSTVLEYMGYLEQSWLFFFIPKYSHSLRARAINPRKVYAIDNGLIAANSKSPTPDEGRKLENLVFLTLRRHYKEIFYFQAKGECDFVVFKDNQFFMALQVCLNLDADNQQREVDGLIEALTFFGKTEGTIVTLNQTDEVKKGDSTIRIISLMALINETTQPKN
jgi:predicted AAA+ superfamily ATPase